MAFQPKQELIFEVELNGMKHQRFTGQLGKVSFGNDLKDKYTKAEALKFVVNNHPKGVAFIETVYKPKKEKATA